MSTPNIGLSLPDYSLPKWDIPTNQNWTIIDAAIGALTAGGASPAGSWTKYTLLVNNPNWFLNGVAVAAVGATSVQQIPIFTLPARTVLHAVFIKHSISFTGGALSSVVCSLGTAAVPDALMAVSGDTFDIWQVPSDFHLYLTGGARMLSAASSPIVLQVTCVGGSPSAMAGGTLEIDVLASVLPS
jgi:hypothetical protein